MWTAVTVLLLASALGVGVGLLVARALRGRSRWARRTLATLTALAVAAASVFGWAALMVNRSAIARAVVWLNADTGDLHRFPSRPIRADDQVLELRACPTTQDILELEVKSTGETMRLGELVTRTGSTSFLVLRDRCLLAETYGDEVAADEPQTSFSMAKSILSTLVGIAIDRGDLKGLDEPITTYLPELADRDERYAEITLRHLVTMSSGLHYEEQGLPWSDDAVTYYSPDLRDTALSAEIEQPPGQEYLYNNFNPLLMGLVLERATGMPVAEYMERHLWGPMGAETDASWSLDSTASGFEKMESGVNATPRDYARFGYLFAHAGRVDGRQVVPADWVAEATAVDTRTDPNPGYQYWWWVDDARKQRFFARGNLGQFIYVDDRADLVIVRTGPDFNIPDWPLVLRQVADQLTADTTGR